MKGRSKMNNQMTRIAKGVIIGSVIGGTAGIALACTVKKPAHSSFRRTAASAMDAVGVIMQNLADITR